MTFGLLITAVVAYVIGSDVALMKTLLSGGALGLVVIVQFGLVLAMSFGMQRMRVGTLTFCFLLYAFSMGITTSIIFAVYQVDTIGQVFAITAGMFGCLALYGSTTKKDLSPVGYFLSMALFGLIIAMVVNIFVHSSGFDLLLSVASVFIFSGLTAYHSQQIKSFALQGDTESDAGHKFAIYGALMLYLNFVNLFFSLLRLMGRRR